jgi:hypothetical protein
LLPPFFTSLFHVERKPIMDLQTVSAVELQLAEGGLNGTKVLGDAGIGAGIGMGVGAPLGGVGATVGGAIGALVGAIVGLFDNAPSTQ